MRVDDRVVIDRKGGLVALVTRRGWPEAQAVIEAVRAALPA